MVSFCGEGFFIGDSWIAVVCSGHDISQSKEANHTKGEEVVSTYDTTHIIVLLGFIIASSVNTHYRHRHSLCWMKRIQLLPFACLQCSPSLMLCIKIIITFKK